MVEEAATISFSQAMMFGRFGLVFAAGRASLSAIQTTFRPHSDHTPRLHICGATHIATQVIRGE
jgi:hypothetical protein